ncbi:hypothetical protein H7H98_10300 [Mycolicibacterium sphagni]|nr:hypothetical protein [Mycolicibacterium sphagni]
MGLNDGDVRVQKMLTGAVQVVAEGRIGGGVVMAELRFGAEQFTLSSRAPILRMKPLVERGARYWD